MKLTATTEWGKIQKNLQNKSKHKNNKCFSWVTAVRFLSLTGSHSPPHLPRMPSNNVLISVPAVGAAQILIWSYSCVLASNVQSYQKPGGPQSTGLQRVGHDQSNPGHIDAGCFIPPTLPWQLCPSGSWVWSWCSWWLVDTLVVLSVQRHGLPLLRELWPYQSLFLSLLWLTIRRLLWPVFLRTSARSGT